jgi:hypothetical protein
MIRISRTTLLFAALAAATTPGDASAQAAGEALMVSVGAGFDFPTGDAAETYRRGVNIGVRMTMPLTPRLAVRGGLGFWKLGRDDDAVLARRGEDPNVFRLGGGFFDGGDRNAFGGLAGVRLDLIGATAAFAPYLHAGGGFAHTEVTRLETYFLGESTFEAGSSETVLLADAGAGAEVRLSPGVWLYGEVGYMTLFTEGTSTALLPVQMGLAVHLGGR